MISRLTHVVPVKGFANWLRQNYLEMSDADWVNAISALWMDGCMNLHEIAEAGMLLQDPNRLESVSLEKLIGKRFVNERFYTDMPDGRTIGVLRRKDVVNNTFLKVLSPAHGLMEIQWCEEYGIVPLTDDLFVCRTFQVLGRKDTEGVIPLACLLVPAEFAWKLPDGTGHNRNLFGGYTLMLQGKIATVPPEVVDACPDVKGALIVTGLLPGRKIGS